MYTGDVLSQLVLGPSILSPAPVHASNVFTGSGPVHALDPMNQSKAVQAEQVHSPMDGKSPIPPLRYTQ